MECCQLPGARLAEATTERPHELLKVSLIES